jgi:hypothetical protein
MLRVPAPHTRIFQQPDHRAIFIVWLPRMLREAHRNVESLHLYRVFQRHGNASEGPLGIDFIFGPFLCLREQDLGQAVRLLVSFDSDLRICTEDIDRTCYLLVDVLNEVLYRLAQNRAFRGRQRIEIRLWKCRYLRSPLGLLPLAVETSALERELQVGLVHFTSPADADGTPRCPCWRFCCSTMQNSAGVSRGESN